jgi:thiamine pyrophosphate-dependent acetolactate synthase large subunit-like protein
MTLHTYDMIARAFAQEDSKTCFALMGDANMAFATRLGEAGCDMVYVRHEHCAVAAAMAWARKTGQVGVATVTCGPGLTQLMTALPAAVRASLPMVILAGEAPSNVGWYNQAIDQAPFVVATGAAYHSLTHPARMPVAIRNAFVQARREKRPVVLSIPFDLQESVWTGDETLPAPSSVVAVNPRPMSPHPEDIQMAVEAIVAAEKIVVMAGLGATGYGDPTRNAAADCCALAEKLDGLLATSLPARGLFHDDPYCLGVAGGFSSDVAREMLGQADLIIAVGCSLAKHNADGGKLWPSARVLQIDEDPIAISQGRIAADLHMRADAQMGVAALTQAIEQPRPASWRNPALATRIATQPADGAEFPKRDGLLDPRDVVAALDQVIPQEWQLVNSSGHCSYYFAHMAGRPYENFLTIREFGAIGNGVSFAMGAAMAHPQVPVVLFDGDGSLLMHVQEIETMRRHGMKILIAVLNDAAYGSEIHKLRAEGLSDRGAVFGDTDLAAIARGFGAGGVRITDLGDVPGAVADYAAAPGVTLLDFPIDDRIISPVIRRSHG